MFDLRTRKNGRPLLVGHRGALEVAPENTMPSFAAGLAGGADILELDVQLTADKQAIVFHDTCLAAKVNLPGMIGDYTADFLRSLDVGSHFDAQFSGVQMPFLHEVLAWAKERIPLMIELKHGPLFDPALDDAVVGLVEDWGMVEDVVLMGADQFALQRVKRINPRIATSFIYSGRLLNPLCLVEDLRVDALGPRTDLLTHEEVDVIHAAGYACSPGGFWWDYARVVAWGVDTITSNNPAAVRWAEILAAKT
ncbi:MAG: hypothetical protein IPM39_18025 [Chloroflexi bacterium]|nr:hypothetical protein [Chloroflexota bacterium]